MIKSHDMEKASKGSTDIATTFNEYFRVAIADSKSAMEAAYHVRYCVYCSEFHYEKEDDCPNQRETDEFDAQSTHCLIIHRPSQVTAGCVRMVPTLADDPDAPLPFEKHCRNALDTEFIDGLGLDRRKVCEISRLAVDGRFRRRTGEKATRFGSTEALGFSEEERRTLPFIAVSAYLAATAITANTGCTNVFAMMEPFLPRLLNRAGIKFQRAGADIDYHGVRAPYFITTESALKGMSADLKGLYTVIYRQLYPSDSTPDLLTGGD